MRMCMGCHKHLNGDKTRPTAGNNEKITTYGELLSIEKLADIIKRVLVSALPSQGFPYWWCNRGVEFQHRSSHVAHVEINCTVAVAILQLQSSYSFTVQTLAGLSRLITR